MRFQSQDATFYGSMPNQEKVFCHNNCTACFFVGRSYTVSVALPGSILENAQSPELRSYLAGQVSFAIYIDLWLDSQWW